MKTATTIDEQLRLLAERGLMIADKEKAREVLEDIGYYRLGFYLFPFEKTYPTLDHRTHEYIEGAAFEDAVRLYYFDFDLRLLLMRYLTRIEIAFRTAMIYHLSNRHKESSIWFANSSVVSKAYATKFEATIYTADFKRNPVISRHHQKNPNDRFAPAWKTMEFMTFGAVIKLYDELKDDADKIFISQKFGVRQIVSFANYLHTVRHVRNACAHGYVLYDLHLSKGIRRGPAGVQAVERSNIIGALRVVKYFMSQVSNNRAMELANEIQVLYRNLCRQSPCLQSLIPDFSRI